MQPRDHALREARAQLDRGRPSPAPLRAVPPPPPPRVANVALRNGAAVVVVHHGSIALDSAGLTGPDRLWQPALRVWMHHVYRDADGVTSAIETTADCGRPPAFALRFGLDPAFVPQPGVRRQQHVHVRRSRWHGRVGRDCAGRGAARRSASASPRRPR